MKDLALAFTGLGVFFSGYLLYKCGSLLVRLLFFRGKKGPKPAGYSEFLSELEADQIVEVTLNTAISSAVVLNRAGVTYQVQLPMIDSQLLLLLNHSKVRVQVVPHKPLKGFFGHVYFIFACFIGLKIVFFCCCVAIFHNVMELYQGRMGRSLDELSKSHHIMVNDMEKVTFADVAGCDEEKRELFELVEYLREPDRFKALGAKLPKGVLMVGPPGTGKTLLAKAVAGEANVRFISVSGSEFVEVYVGMGAARVRELFVEAKKNAPCIIFIDELDAVGRKRSQSSVGGSQESDQTLNQLLVEMDGFKDTQNVIIMGATNRPEVLDRALLRPGRFDRTVTVALPDRAGREKILGIHAKTVPLASDVKLGIIARGTPGFSGAELANLVNEAALFAARDHHTSVSMAHLEKAREKLLLGLAQTSRILLATERACTAYHEAGHTIVSKLLPDLDPIYKVTIIPRQVRGGAALGMTTSLPEDDYYSRDRQFLEHELAMFYGGWVAEELIYGKDHVTTGPSNDIERATHLARRMVVEWGFSDKLGPILYADINNSHGIPCLSNETAVEIDEAVKSFLVKAYNKAHQLLSQNMDILHAMKEALLEYETIDAEQVDRLMARKPLTPL